MLSLVNLEDYKILAKEKLTQDVFDYIESGAGDEITKRGNRQAFDTMSLRPFCLERVSQIKTSRNLFGKDIAFPLLIAPMALHRLVHESGEVAVAKAAKEHHVPMIVSMSSSFSLEEIAHQSENDKLWLQVYIFKDRGLTENLIKRAEAAGYKAILITVGVPQIGKRDKVIRRQSRLPSRLSLGNFEGVGGKNSSCSVHEFIRSQLDPSVTWKDIEWVKKITKLPIILKGIMNPQDAEKACFYNIEGIVVSNHGGRQLDTTEPTLHVLPSIVNVVQNRSVVMVDGSVERGTDILKAVALGAQAVLVGRPVLWALAVDGEEEVIKALTLLREEFELSMKLSGLTDISKINTSILGSRLVS